MLEGLEVSVITKSELEKDNEVFRADAEYFDKENLLLINRIKKIGYKKVDEFSFVTDGIHTAIDYSLTSTVNLISATSPKENYFDLSRQVFISEEAHLLNPRTALKENDVIISTVGTIGNCAVVSNEILPANSDRHVGIIRIEKDFLPRFVSTFLLTKYGRFQTNRESTGNVQLNLYIIKLKGLKIPTLSNSFQTKIEETVKLAHNKQQHSKTLYTEAETILLQELGLANWQPTIKNNNTKTLKESFLQSGRIDAEYYQPKYDEIELRIKNYELGFDTVSNKFELVKTEVKLKKEAYNYIEIGDVSTSNGEISYNKIETEQLPANAKIKAEKGNLLVSKVRPYRGAVSIINEDIKDLIVSGAFTVLKEKSNYNIETLSVLLKTFAYKELMMKYNVGSSYPVIRDEDILNLPIPNLPDKTQTLISQKIQESFALQAQSKQLLEAAKLAVEIAIEQGEEEAMGYLSKL